MILRLNREDLLLARLALLGVPVSGVLGALGPSLQIRSLALIFAAVGLVWAATRPWGAVAVFAPVALVPSFPEPGGIDRLLVASGITWILVTIHWFSGAGRPRVDPVPLLGIAFLAVYALGQAIFRELPLNDAVAMPSLWAAGIVLGVCIARRRQGLLAIGLLGAVAGLLAIAELAGFRNVWHAMTGGSFNLVGTYGGAQRAFSTFGHPLVAGVAIATCGALAVHSRSRLLWLIVPLCVGGSLATVSRSAMLGMVGAVVVVLVQSKSRLPQTLAAIFATVAVAVGLAAAIPDFGSSLSIRLTDDRFQRQTVRDYAVDQISSDASRNLGPLVFGEGIGTPYRMMDSFGGIDGFRVFDNQYITAIYDFGMVPLAIAFVMVTIRFRRRGFQIAAPAGAVLAISLWFFDGLAWAPIGLLAGIAVGIATGRGIPDPNRWMCKE